MDNFYYTIEKEGRAEFKDRGSLFIGYALPLVSVEGFKPALNTIKDQHPKASHHCFAYRIGLDGNIFRVSDDGEPSGTAGRPILGQIDSRQLTDVLVVVVRYFGGTLLGVAGLINAYRNAASMSLQVVPAVKKEVMITYKFEFDYTRLNDVMTIIKQNRCQVLQQDFQLFSIMIVQVPVVQEELLKKKLELLQGVNYARVASITQV